MVRRWRIFMAALPIADADIIFLSYGFFYLLLSSFFFISSLA